MEGLSAGTRYQYGSGNDAVRFQFEGQAPTRDQLDQMVEMYRDGRGRRFQYGESSLQILGPSQANSGSFLGGLFGGGLRAPTERGVNSRTAGAATRVGDTAGGAQRSLTFYSVNTGERSRVDYRAGNPSRQSLEAFSDAMVDWRTGERARMDPDLLDAIHALQVETGSVSNTIRLISGYRSPETQRAKVESGSTPARSLGYHPRGQAVDLAIEGVSYSELLAAARRLQARGLVGGLGAYPGNGYIHIDTGPRRSW